MSLSQYKVGDTFALITSYYNDNRLFTTYCWVWCIDIAANKLQMFTISKNPDNLIQFKWGGYWTEDLPPRYKRIDAEVFYHNATQLIYEYKHQIPCDYVAVDSFIQEGLKGIILE